MKYFITSSPCDDNVPEGVKLPCILFEKNQFVANLKKGWREDSKLLIITAFADNDSLNDEMRETFEKAFNYHELTCTIKVLDHRTYDMFDQLMEESNGLILGGGHVPTALKIYEKLDLKKSLESWEGHFILGISAGSMNMADHVYIQPEEAGEGIDPEFAHFGRGLGLTDVNILPHYQKTKNYILDGLRLYEDITYKDSFGEKFYVLPDSSYVLCENGRETIYGESYLIHDGQIHMLCKDEEIVIL